MKKPRYSRILNVLQSIFAFRKWADYDRLKSFTLYLRDGFKKMFVPQKNKKSESFTHAVEKFNLSEEELLARQKALYRLSILMSIAAVLIFSYAIYHLFYGSFKAVFVSLAVMLIAWALAFRYHFWYYQIKERKLGCTFQEWFRHGLMGEKQ